MGRQRGMESGLYREVAKRLLCQTDRETDKEMNEREGIVVYLNADMQTNEVKILEVLVLLQQKRQ